MVRCGQGQFAQRRTGPSAQSRDTNGPISSSFVCLAREETDRKPRRGKDALRADETGRPSELSPGLLWSLCLSLSSVSPALNAMPALPPPRQRGLGTPGEGGARRCSLPRFCESVKRQDWWQRGCLGASVRCAFAEDSRSSRPCHTCAEPHRAAPWVRRGRGSLSPPRLPVLGERVLRWSWSSRDAEPVEIDDR